MSTSEKQTSEGKPGERVGFEGGRGSKVEQDDKRLNYRGSNVSVQLLKCVSFTWNIPIQEQKILKSMKSFLFTLCPVD